MLKKFHVILKKFHYLPKYSQKTPSNCFTNVHHSTNYLYFLLRLKPYNLCQINSFRKINPHLKIGYSTNFDSFLKIKTKLNFDLKMSHLKQILQQLLIHSYYADASYVISEEQKYLHKNSQFLQGFMLKRVYLPFPFDGAINLGLEYLFDQHYAFL
jgi:hypothetical protein